MAAEAAHLVDSRRGGKNLVYMGHCYNQQDKTAKGFTVWICKGKAKYNCKAKCKTIEEMASWSSAT